MGGKDFLSLYSCLWFFSLLEQRGRGDRKITQPPQGWGNQYLETPAASGQSLNFTGEEVRSLPEIIQQEGRSRARNGAVSLFIHISDSAASQSTVHRPADSMPPGYLLKCKSSGLTLDLLNQRLEGWGQAFCVFTSLPGDPDGHSSLRTAVGVYPNSQCFYRLWG